jgi:hypothetical protein
METGGGSGDSGVVLIATSESASADGWAGDSVGCPVGMGNCVGGTGWSTTGMTTDIEPGSVLGGDSSDLGKVAAGAASEVGDVSAGWSLPLLAAGIKNLAPQLGQMPRLPARCSFTLSLCPLGHANRIPMGRPLGRSVGDGPVGPVRMADDS